MNEVVIMASYSDTELLPTIYRFTVPDCFGREDVIELFDAGLQKAKACDEDGLGMYAAEHVCENTGGTMAPLEVDQVFGI